MGCSGGLGDVVLMRVFGISSVVDVIALVLPSCENCLKSMKSYVTRRTAARGVN